MKYTLLVLSGIILALSGCADRIDMLSGNFESYSVVLVPVEGDTLEIESLAQGWDAAGKQKGYVGFEKGKFGTIIVTLDEKPSRPVCTDDAATSAEWVITKVELSKNGNPTNQKGEKFGGNQKGWLTKAFPGANDNGILRDVGKADGTISLTVENLNNNNGARMAYYQVTAMKCADGATLVTDPGWKNGGHQ